MDPPQDFKSVQENIQTALVATTRLTNQIAAEDISFQRTSNPDVEEQLDDTSSRLLSLATSLLSSATKGTDLKGPALEDSDDVDVHWSRIIDVIDTLLEKADTCLDEYTGVIKRKTAPTEQPGPPQKKSRSTTLDNSLRRANIIKPQNAFELKPNNLDPLPWKPILTAKPHALISLEKSLGTFVDDNQATQYVSYSFGAEYQNKSIICSKLTIKLDTSILMRPKFTSYNTQKPFSKRENPLNINPSKPQQLPSSIPLRAF